jgi:hypothetical protein
MGRNEAIAAHIAKQVMANTRKRFSALHADALSEFEKEAIKMSKSPSCTTSGMAVESSNVVVARRPAPLETPAQQQADALASASVNRVGSADHTQPRVSPNQNGNPFTPPTDDQGISTDASDGGAFTVSRDSYKQLEGKGAGPAAERATKDGVTDSLATATDNGGARSAMRGQQNSKFYNENKNPNFKSTPVGLDSDAGNS